MLNIRKLQEAKATKNQIETAKLLYYDLDKTYDLSLFAKLDHIRIYVQDCGWFQISRAGRIIPYLEQFYKQKIMSKLTQRTIALLATSSIKVKTTFRKELK